jgi:2'-5' RNA ligase
VHCTLKGFFKPKEGTTYQDFVGKLDGLFKACQPATVEFIDLWQSKSDKQASILLGMDNNEPLKKLHNDIWAVVEDYIAPDCAFSAREPKGDRFTPHITLAQYDLPTEAGLFAQAEEFCRYLLDTHLKGQFSGRSLQLIEFYADDWAGDWGDNMRYQQLKGWRL